MSATQKLEIGKVVQDENGIHFRIEELSKPEQLLPEVPSEEIGLKLVESIEGTGINRPSLIDFGNHAFIGSMYRAYADHRPLILSPDMIWLLISQGFSRHVNYNAKEFAELAGLQTEKQALRIRNDKLFPGAPKSEWEKVLHDFTDQLTQKAWGELIESLLPQFSTTNTKEKIAGMIIAMDSLKSFFEYIVITCICGIPVISLEGEQKDWILLKEKALSLKKL